MNPSHDEREDSRTFEAGRRRDSTEFMLSRATWDDPSYGSEHRSHKRIKQDHMADPRFAQGGDMANPSPPSLLNIPPPDTPQILPTEQQNTGLPPTLTTWNKGVQSSLRTSFASRSQPQAPAPLYSEGRALRDAKDLDNQVEEAEPQARAPIPVGIQRKAPYEAVNVDPQVEVVADTLQPPKDDSNLNLSKYKAVDTPRPISDRGPSSGLGCAASSRLLVPSNAFYPEDTKTKPKESPEGNLQLPEPGVKPSSVPKAARKAKPVTAKTKPGSQNQQPPPKAEPVYTNRHGKFDLSVIIQDNKPIPPEKITFTMFMHHFLSMNATKLEVLAEKQIKAAFNVYLTLYYKGCPPNALYAARASAAIKSAGPLCTATLQKAKRENVGKKTNMSEAPSTSQLPTGEYAQGGRDAPHKSGRDTPLVPQPPAERAMPADRAGRDTAPGNVVPSYDDPEAEYEDREASPPADEALDVALSGLELELLQKYFPPVAGNKRSPKCLACSGDGHRTYDCPDLTCNLCGGNHSLSTCPQNQRCGKCRVRGHRASECAEKLSILMAEVGGCDICQSKNHLEPACHFLWRSYCPKPDEIRTVQNIPVHCYVCGASGHYGPECGLHRGKILSGGNTWSKANLQKYLDPASSDRAISAGADYSLPRQGFSIKGKANDPIIVDETDDETSFIRPKVNPPTKRQRSGSGSGSQYMHQIQNPTVGREIPVAPASHRERNNIPRQGRPPFGGNPSLRESMRYGRERSFSPPPRLETFYNPEYRPEQYNSRRAMQGDGSSRGGKLGNGGGRGGSTSRRKKRGQGSRKD